MILCILCAQQGASCCLGRDILITSHDKRRIASYTGVTNFFEFRGPGSVAYLEQDDDPNWNAMTINHDNSRLVLKRKGAEGSCFFLSNSGCNLPYAFRPLICRLHPVEYSEKQITGLSSDCPVGLLPKNQTLLDNLQMNLEEAEQLRTQLYFELKEDWAKRQDPA
jgi:Fe-S-cluster containining protein